VNLQTLAKLKTKNSVFWTTRVGRMHSRNNIVVSEGRVFLSTSGAQWNAPDVEDGIHCIDMETGEKIWFAQTKFDPNEISLIDNVILAGNDAGTIFAFSAGEGRLLDEIKLNAPTYVRALKLGSAGHYIGILITKSGAVVQYNFTKNKFSVMEEIPHSFRSNPVAINENEFLVGSEDGSILRVSVGKTVGDFSWKRIFQVPEHRASGPYDFALKVKGISSIIVAGDKVIVSYVRETYDRRPPMVCFSLNSGTKLWDASRVSSSSKSENQEFGNSRITPVVWKDIVLSTFAYNESVHAFALDTGKWNWRLRLDDSYFQNWSSPIIQDDRLFVARINGVLSVIDLNSREILESYSLEVIDIKQDVRDDRKLFNEREAWPNAESTLTSSGPDPGQELIAGICSTPAIWNDKIVIGTVSGQLYCLRSTTPNNK
jgi:outer membrane protein assembly factor BamB